MTVPGGTARLPAAVIGVLMSKRKQRQKPEISKQTDYYKLHTKAVDDLAEFRPETENPGIWQAAVCQVLVRGCHVLFLYLGA